MSWDDTKQAKDDFLSSEWNSMVSDQKSRCLVSTGSGSPSSTPGSVGDLYVDTSGGRIYIATGTSGAGDWKEVLSQ